MTWFQPCSLAIERATYATKLFLILLALVKQHCTVEQGASAVQVEVESWIQRWGEVHNEFPCYLLTHRIVIMSSLFGASSYLPPIISP
ncbi:hypothetical protein EDC04DRAFT_3104621 [Pisolithus marmoratus]|nr:hypothetical protein EDC04DRAFT_3104621 [Pisolithus marmoratus]